MQLKIYQINLDRDTSGFAFKDLEYLQKHQDTNEINIQIYDKVYEGFVKCKSLEDVYHKFNADHPAEYRGRSLSVSDIIEITEAPEINPGFYFCDSVGFEKVEFEPTDMKKDTIRVVLVEPGKPAREAQIGTSLEDMQAVVGGYIEQYCPYKEMVAIICDDEGKVNGKALNRAIYGENGQMVDIVAGSFFICSIPQNSDRFESLSDKQTKKYLELFQSPERFYREFGEIRAVKYNPEKQNNYER